jgi:hypothetical protein
LIYLSISENCLVFFKDWLGREYIYKYVINITSVFPYNIYQSW